jgi:hypothetical protein
MTNNEQAEYDLAVDQFTAAFERMKEEAIRTDPEGWAAAEALAGDHDAYEAFLWPDPEDWHLRVPSKRAMPFDLTGWEQRLEAS